MKLRRRVNGHCTPGRKVPLFHCITGGVGSWEGPNAEQNRTNVSCTRESNPTPVRVVPSPANRWHSLRRLRLLHSNKHCQQKRERKSKLLYQQFVIKTVPGYSCRCRWPRGLTRGFAAVRLLGLRGRIPPEAWMSVCREWCVLSGRGLCVRLITRPEGS